MTTVDEKKREILRHLRNSFDELKKAQSICKEIDPLWKSVDTEIEKMMESSLKLMSDAHLKN